MNDEPLNFNTEFEYYIWLHREYKIKGRKSEAIATEVGSTRRSIRARFSQLKKAFGALPEDEHQFENLAKCFTITEETYEDGTRMSKRIIAIEDTDKTPESLLEAHKYTPASAWKLLRTKNMYWQGQRSWRIGGGAQTLYESAIWVIPAEETVTAEGIVSFFDNYILDPKPRMYYPKTLKQSGQLLETVLCDQHFALRPHVGKSTVVERHRDTMTDIFQRARKEELEQIIMAQPGDVFHFDTIKGKTPSDIQMDTYIGHQEAFDLALGETIWSIDSAVEIAPVKFIVVPGNHDPMISYMFAKALDLYYRFNEHVEVIPSKDHRHWEQWGKSVIGWTHGNIPKSRVGAWIHLAAKSIWNQIEWAEIHVGHLHHQVTQEDNSGVIVRWLPTITPTDNWHSKSGFTGSARGTCSFIWDKEKGLRSQWYSMLSTLDEEGNHIL